MPIYEYKCRGCGEIFEAFRGISQSNDDIACPHCGEKKPNKLFSSFFRKLADSSLENLRFPT